MALFRFWIKPNPFWLKIVYHYQLFWHKFATDKVGMLLWRRGDLKIIATSLATHFRNNPSSANQRTRAHNTRAAYIDRGPLISLLSNQQSCEMHLEIRNKHLRLFTFRHLAWLPATKWNHFQLWAPILKSKYNQVEIIVLTSRDRWCQHNHQLVKFNLEIKMASLINLIWLQTRLCSDNYQIRPEFTLAGC